MGTRDYAEAVAKEIDPEGSLFKERILSRDESGSKYKCFIFINLGCLHTSI
jgi:TFIIF-interacting CTD phosphatase-like protein